MSSPATDDLLAPSLAGHRRLQPIYSLRACFFIFFFGGPIAGAIVTAVNAHRLRRLAKDAWLVALGFGAALLLLVWVAQFDGNDWLRATFGRSGPRLASRIVAFAYFGVTYLVHRPFHRHMAFAGIESPSPWRVGIVSVLAAAAIGVALALVVSV